MWNKAAIALVALATSGTAKVISEQPLDTAHSVILADAEGNAGHYALYIVSKATGQKLVTLDSDPHGFIAAIPTLEVLPDRTVYLHFFGDYGFYGGSIKYVYDLSGAKAVQKIPYPRVALISSEHDGGKLRYQASYIQNWPDGWGEGRATIFLEPATFGFHFFVDDVRYTAGPQTIEPPPLHGAGGETVRVENTPVGQAHRPAAIAVGASLMSEHRYPVPIPTLDFYRRTLPEKQPAGEIESDIGPFVQHGDRIWFASTFYDGEGTSGVGAIGSFDVSSRRYEMHYLAEIAPWSGSAILLDGDDLWIGLKRRPEGADIGAGLLRYSISSGAVQTYAIPDVIFTIDRAGDALYCGTSHGLYVLRAHQLTQLRFEPDATGKLTMIPRPIEK